jgi:hypothetical protein
MAATAHAPGALATFQARAEALVDRHPVVTSNPYTRWFASGEATFDDVRHLTVQFSVFSHLFVEAQLRKVINAPSLEAYHGGKEILLNELGVVFRPTGRPAELADGDVVATEGSVEGSRYFHRAAHFEWLLRFAAPLGLGFEQLGRRRHGTPSTLFFCDELLRVYGADDPSTAQGASFAVERWAAAGFWKELIAGLEAFRAQSGLDLARGTPPTSSPRCTANRGSTNTVSSPARTRCSTASTPSGPASKPTAAGPPSTCVADAQIVGTSDACR